MAFQRVSGLYWETAAFATLLAAMELRAPHTGEPVSEALLFGLSRGIGALYFAFDHPGREPYFFFNPRRVEVGGDAVSDLCRRLDLEAAEFQTDSPALAQEYLLRCLQAGQPVMLWADRTRLPWGWAPTAIGPWMAPIVAYSLEDGVVQVADRARVALTCQLEVLLAAWGAQAKGSHRALTLEAVPALGDLRPGFVDALGASASGMLSGPTPNFGLRALETWAAGMTDPADRRGWPVLFGSDRLLFANLVRAYLYIELEGTGGGAARPLYAAFLEEAADVLGQPALRAVAARYRDCGAAWTRVADACLPSYFRRTREVLQQREARFRAGGLPGVEETRRLEEYVTQAEIPDAAGLRGQVRERLLEVLRLEQEAAIALAGIVRGI